MHQHLGKDYQQRVIDSFLYDLKKPQVIEDCRLDAQQLSYSEKYDDVSNVWKVSVICGYPDPEDIEMLNKAVQTLGFVID